LLRALFSRRSDAHSGQECPRSNMILVIREYDNFSRILAANNFEIINLLLIETVAIDNLSVFETIENYDGVFLTSSKATEIFKANLEADYRGKVYVLGKRSYEILKGANLNLHYDESANTAREMLENIAPDELKNKHFLFIRGDKSLRIVPEFLAKTATVDEAIVYETRSIKVEIDKINELREKNKFAAICFFSPSAAESFIEQFGAEILHQTVIATIGKTTAEFFETRNLQVNFVASKATAEDFATELIEYLSSG
jgi:uroporphyrinogen-III synthase